MLTRRDLLKSSTAAGAVCSSAGISTVCASRSRPVPRRVATARCSPTRRTPRPARRASATTSSRRPGASSPGRPTVSSPAGPTAPRRSPAILGTTVLVNNHEQSTGDAFPAVADGNLTYDPGAGGGHDDHRGRQPQPGRPRVRQPGRHVQQLRRRRDAVGHVAHVRGDRDSRGRRLHQGPRLRVRGRRRTSHSLNLDPTPLTALGRFAHEAVVVDPRRGHLYLTEDAQQPERAALPVHARSLPSRLPRCGGGGLLEAMWSPGVPDLSVFTRSAAPRSRCRWKAECPIRRATTVSTRKPVHGDDITRSRKFEGMWWGDDRAYIVCSFARLQRRQRRPSTTARSGRTTRARARCASRRSSR